jgi:hypothetical protein
MTEQMVFLMYGQCSMDRDPLLPEDAPRNYNVNNVKLRTLWNLATRSIIFQTFRLPGFRRTEGE